MNPTIESIPASWPAPPGIVAGCTTRAGGVSEGRYQALNLGDHVGDSAEDVCENRARFVAGCGLPAEPVWLTQVHGIDVVVDPPRDAPGATPIEADAVLSRQAGSACAVMIADCLPLLFVSADGREIAAAHAGWRGLSAGVVEATLQAFSSRPARILVWLGPAISQPHFEVGDEVRQVFLAADAAAERYFLPNERGRYQADLYGLARQRLKAAGVREIYGGEYCTYADSEVFFSYRREGQCGRMASFIARLT